MHKTVKIIILCICAFAVVVTLIPFLFVAMQTKILEKSFNNQIIDSNYQGWNAVNLDNDIEIKLPKTWKLERFDDRILIIDSTGKQIAAGVKLPFFSPEEENVFIETLFNGRLTESRLIWTSGLIYKNMTSNRATELKFDDGRTETYVSVDLPYYSDYKYFVCFFSDSNGMLYSDEVEAIAYSMTYN